MILTKFGINDMESFFAALNPFFDKREQEMILLLGVPEESADVTMCTQLRAGEANGMFLVSTSEIHDDVLSLLNDDGSAAEESRQRAPMTINLLSKCD